ARLDLLGKEVRIEGKTIDGQAFDTATLAGKYVLVDFWATWCGPCIEERGFLTSTYEEFKETPFEIVSVSIDRDRTAVQRFLKQADMDWVNLWDESQLLAERYGILGVPTMMLIDPNGKLLYQTRLSQTAAEKREEAILQCLRRSVSQHER
ncbi:MAG: TlpA disulfide reductase family protein, partial [Planctomycetota bacterium]